MTDQEINKLEQLLKMLPGLVWWRDPFEAAYFPIAAIKHNHRDTDDPQEPPESIALLGDRSGKHVGLLNADADEFVLLKTDVTPINWS